MFYYLPGLGPLLLSTLGVAIGIFINQVSRLRKQKACFTLPVGVKVVCGLQLVLDSNLFACQGAYAKF